MPGAVDGPASIWILLDPDDATCTAVLNALRADAAFAPVVEGWPSRNERRSPAAVVFRHPAAERPAALKHRLGEPKAIVLLPPSGSATRRAP